MIKVDAIDLIMEELLGIKSDNEFGIVYKNPIIRKIYDSFEPQGNINSGTNDYNKLKFKKFLEELISNQEEEKKVENEISYNLELSMKDLFTYNIDKNEIISFSNAYSNYKDTKMALYKKENEIIKLISNSPIGSIAKKIGYQYSERQISFDKENNKFIVAVDKKNITQG